MTSSNVILFADDEPTLTEALSFVLESQGFSCITATSMSEAVAALSKYAIRVLVTDIMMPAGLQFQNVDSSEAGFHLIKFVHENWPALPVVCLSVIADQHKIQDLADRGVRYLRKGETPLATAIEVITAVALGRSIRL